MMGINSTLSVSPPMWIHSTLTKGQRGLAYSYTFKVMLGGFTQGVVTKRTLLPRAWSLDDLGLEEVICLSLAS